MENTEYILSTTNLTKKYGDHLAVDNINIRVKKGIVYGFLGPNGAGKTTTIRMLLGLIKPTSGSAKIFGFDMNKDRAMIAPKIAAIVEQPAFYPYLSGRKNLEVLARSSNISPKHIDLNRLFAKVGLTGNEDKIVKAYSLGMKQRLGIATALLNNPDIVFLDEPTNGLDPAGIIEIRQLLRQFAVEEQRTVFLSSHLLTEVEQVCDEVTLLVNGRVKITGEVRQLLEADSFVFIKASPFQKAQLIIQKTFPHLSFRADEQSEILQIITPESSISDLVRSLVIQDVMVKESGYRRRSLEDLFLEITQSENAKAATNS